MPETKSFTDEEIKLKFLSMSDEELKEFRNFLKARTFQLRYSGTSLPESALKEIRIFELATDEVIWRRDKKKCSLEDSTKSAGEH